MDPLTTHYLPWVAGLSLAAIGTLAMLSKWVLGPTERRHRAHLLDRPALEWEEVAKRISNESGDHERRAYLLAARRLGIAAGRMPSDDPLAAYTGPVERQVTPFTGVAALIDEVEDYAAEGDRVVETVADLVRVLAAAPDFRSRSAEIERRLRLRWTP